MIYGTHPVFRGEDPSTDRMCESVCPKKVFKIAIYDRCSVIGEHWNMIVTRYNKVKYVTKY